MSEVEKRVVIRLQAETEMEQVKKASKMFRDFWKITDKADRTLGKMYKSKQRLNKAITAEVNALKKAVKMQKDLDDAMKKNLVSAQSLEKREKAITAAVKDYEAAVKEAKKAQQDYNKIQGKKLAVTVAATKGVMKAAGALRGAYSKALGMAVKGVKMLSVALIAAGAFGAKSFSSLENEIAKVGLVINMSSQEADMMRGSLREMSQSSVFGAKELGNAMFEVGAMMGDLGAVDVTKIVDQAQMMSVASGFGDATQAGELLVGVYRMFGDTAPDAEKDVTEQTKEMSAQIMKAANDTALSVGDISTALQFVGGSASALEQPLSSTLAALGMLRNTGMEASVASTALNMVMTNLADPSEEASKWMRRLGIETVDAEGNFKDITTIAGEVTAAFEENGDMFRDDAHRMEVLQEMYGVRGARAMTIFMNTIGQNSEALSDMAVSFQDIEGGLVLMEDGFNKFMATPEATFKAMQNQVMNLGAILGDAFLMDTAEDGTKTLKGFIVTLQELLMSEQVQSFMHKLGETLGIIAEEMMPLIMQAMDAFLPILFELLDIIVELVSDEGFQAMMSMIIEIAAVIGGQFIRILRKLMPILFKLFDVFADMAPLIDFIIMLFDIAVPIIEILANLMVVFFKILKPFIPLFTAIGKLFGMVFGAILVVLVGIGGIILWLVGIVGDVLALLGDDSLKKEVKSAQKDMEEMMESAAALATGAAFTEIGDVPEMTIKPEDIYTPAAGFPEEEEEGGAGDTIVNVDGNIIGQDEYVEQISDNLVDEYKRGGKGPY